MARGLKLWIKEEEGLHCLCSENKGAEQLHGYRTAYLHLCLCICKMQVFSWQGSYVEKLISAVIDLSGMKSLLIAVALFIFNAEMILF